jgi:signal transduction histidine kinase
MKQVEKFTSTGRIARTIAHEIRNPLMNINLAVEELKTGISLRPHQAMLELITRNSNRINALITSLLDSTKFTDISIERIDTNQLLEETLEFASDRITLQKVEVVKELDSNLCHIRGDREKLRIAILNVIINALEAMEGNQTNGVLKVQTGSMNGRCFIKISDNGPGMDNDTVGKLFEPYFTTKSKGNGLGLTNTQSVILSHKGEIDVSSEPLKGTCFTIQLDFASLDS